MASSTAANPTPPAAPEHEHGITGLHLGDAAQRVICGGVRDRERGGVLELDRVGHPGEAGRRRTTTRSANAPTNVEP